ncbi:hypothetical protein IQ06DRAFT_364690 [Phaeosphaeriaceae sp. SRC1lsM3a]|nr:hypothetical protein IQ06DRAFT_364690 [Stagonospora sp. SRC1lsM3a]
MNGRSFPIRKNLWRFLKEASHLPTKDANESVDDGCSSIFRASLKSLWIDALCIDQANEAEKNHEVQQMGRIYRQADRIFAWIDDDEGGEDVAAMFRFSRTHPVLRGRTK